MLERIGLGRTFIPLLRWAQRREVRYSTVPAEADKMPFDPGKPVCYALHVRQLSALLVLEEAAERLGLPRPLSPLAAPGLQERSSFMYLTRGGQPSPLRPNPYEYSKRLERMVATSRGEARDPNNYLPAGWESVERRPEKGRNGLLNGCVVLENMRIDGEFVTSCWLWIMKTKRRNGPCVDVASTRLACL